MGERNLQACRGGKARGDTGNDFGGDARRAQGIELLSAAAKHERVSALEPHHGLTGARALNQERIDLTLRHAVVPLRLADGDQLDLAAGMVEHACPDQAVVKDDVGGFQGTQRFQGQKLRIAGSGADQQHAPLGWA